MKKRNPIAVLLLGFVTIFIYSWYWAVKTKGEMNKLGENIPTAWIWLIPIFGSIWWYWKYSEAVEHVTHEKMNGVLAFVVLYLLGAIGQAIIQDSFNKIEPATVTAAYTPPSQQVVTSSPGTGPMNVVVSPSENQDATKLNPTPPPTYSPPNPPANEV